MSAGSRTATTWEPNHGRLTPAVARWESNRGRWHLLPIDWGAASRCGQGKPKKKGRKPPGAPPEGGKAPRESGALAPGGAAAAMAAEVFYLAKLEKQKQKLQEQARAASVTVDACGDTWR
eukprot:89118-Prymnesium_polylepis.1